MQRFIAFGALAGIFLGIILSLLFPVLLKQEFVFNILFNKQLGYPPLFYYSPRGGSVLTVLVLFPFIFGLIGFLIGCFLFRIRKKLTENKIGKWE